METKTDVLPLAIVALLAGGILYPSRSQTDSSSSGETTSQPATMSSPAGPPADLDGDTAHNKGALDLMAEYFGLDVTTQGLRRRARDAVNVLSDNDVLVSKKRDAALFLRSLLALDIRRDDSLGLEAAQRAVSDLNERQLDKLPDDTLATVPEHLVGPLRRFVAAYFNDDALKLDSPRDEPKLLALDFDRLDKEPLALDVVRRAAFSARTDVRFLVATVPDPVESHAGWQFDPIVEIIQAAATESGYVLDRFFIPDLNVDKARHVHERSPGVILFRDSHGDDTDARYYRNDPSRERCELLVVFLVTETPTFGVHHSAFTSAVSFIKNWGATSEVAVLGPTFSGSSESLRTALRSLPEDVRGSEFRFISGSATSRANQGILEGTFPGRVTFHATVPPDDVLAWIPYQHVENSGNRPGTVAFLVEANTEYGAAMSANVNGRSAQAGLVVPFPMHVSRLRGDLMKDRKATATPMNLLPRFRPLVLQELVTPIDQLPSPSFKTTSSYVELVLANIIDSIRRENVRTVGLMGTDSRDKLLLAQQISKYAPDVALFTTESDLLYSHPDSASYMTGVVIASAYPLFARTQHWSRHSQGDSRWREFPTSATQGIYNAALALLNYDQSGSPIYLDKVPALLDYGIPGKPCAIDGCRPQAWLSVPSGGAIWPIKVNELAPDRYTFAVRMPDGRTPEGQPNSPTAEAQVLLTLLSIVVALHLAACFLIAFGGGAAGVVGRQLACHRRLHRLVLSFHGESMAQRRYLLMCISSVSIPYGFLATLHWMWRGNEPWSVISISVLLLAGGLIVCLCWLTHITLLVPLGRALKMIREDGRLYLRLLVYEAGANLPSALGWVGISGLCTWSAWSLIRYFRDALADPVGINAILLVERATQLDNGISQVVLVLCLAGAIYTCGLFQLVRLHLPGPALTDESYVQPLMDRCAMGGVYDLKEKLRFLEGSFLRLPAWALLVVVTGGILVWVFAFNPVSRPLMTVEGSRFNQFATASLLVVQLAIALTLLKVVYGWHLLKQVLHRLSCHPLVETYARIPARLLPRTVFPRQPRFEELHVAVDHWRALRADEDGPPLDPSLPSVQDLETTFQSELAKQPGTAWLQSRTWQTLASAAGRLSADIQGQWIAEAVPGEQISSRLRFEASAKGDIHRRAAAPSAVAVEPRKWLAAAKRRRRRQEEFVALPIVFVIRDALARLGHQVVFVMGATFLVLCSHLLYSFQSKQHMLRIIWADILITVAVTLTVLVQVERNPVISRIASLSPDRLSWDREFVTKLFVYGLLPLLGLFATQFPGVGEGLMRWIEPVQRAIP